VATEESLEEIDQQVASNQAALPAAVEANQKAGGAEAEQNLAAVNAILGLTTTLAEFPTQTPRVDVGDASETGVVGGGDAVGNGNGWGNAVGGNGNGSGRGGNGAGSNLNHGGAAGAGAGASTGNGNGNGNGASTGTPAGNAGTNVNNGNAAGNGGNGGGQNGNNGDRN
jgi:hypothetical protein